MDLNLYKKSQLTEKQLAILEGEMQKRKKSTLLAYLLWIFFGAIGAHQFYLGNLKRGLLYLGLWLLSIASLFITLSTAGYDLFSPVIPEEFGSPTGLGLIVFVIGGILAFILAFFLLYDLFTMPKQIREADEKEEAKIIQEIMSIT